MSEQPMSITPHLTVKNATAAIEFYKKSLGFTELRRMPMPNGLILHCSLSFGNQMLMLHDEIPSAGQDQCRSPESLGGTSVTIHLNVPDVDAAFAKAIAGGATAKMQPADMFWGDRYGVFIDPFGHQWAMATHKEDVSAADTQKRAEAMFAKWK